jgi:DNA uptake protein ComE-like DNA-binding protein
LKLSPNYFSKRQSFAIFILVLTVVALELLFVLWPFVLPFFHQSDKFLEAQIEKEYQVLQTQSLKTKSLYSGLFNPNFIGFYKGYTLGMSVEEIERLQRFRASNQWINSDSDFQKVSGISDSLLSEIAPYFKFPKWVGESRQKNTGSSKSISKLDLNTASVEALRQVNGIGAVLSKRILNYKAGFEGGFADLVELRAIYGLSPEVIDRIKHKFTIKTPRLIERIDLNTAAQEALVKVPYIDYELAYQIVEIRLLKEAYQSVDELTKLKDFPAEKLDIIKLYLSINIKE